MEIALAYILGYHSISKPCKIIIAEANGHP